MAAEDEDKINKLPDEAPQGEGNTIEAKKYTEQELKDMKEQPKCLKRCWYVTLLMYLG